MNQSEFEFGEGNEYLSLDFSRCQRPDGSFYGTGGQCRKGAPVGAREKEASKPKGRKPIDTSRIGAWSDRELTELVKRKELDPGLKTAIATELKKRRQASDEFDKSGNQARTEKAEKDRENSLVRKSGGFVPRPGEPMQISGDNSYLGRDELAGNIEFQKNTFDPISNKQARLNLEHADRLLANGATKNGQEILWGGNGVSLNKMVDGYGVTMYNNAGIIGWMVNGQYQLNPSIPQKSRKKIALESRKMWETFARSASNGTVLTTSAATGDGRGAARAKAYNEMGFSKARSAGQPQYAKAVNGNVVPATRAEYVRWNERITDGDLPIFAESFKQPTTKELDRLWQIIIGI